MTQFKEGDEVAWIVKYIKRDTTHASVNNGVSIQLETSPGNFVLVHNPQLHSAFALDVNKELLAENERLKEENYHLWNKFHVISEKYRSRMNLLNAFSKIDMLSVNFHPLEVIQDVMDKSSSAIKDLTSTEMLLAPPRDMTERLYHTLLVVRNSIQDSMLKDFVLEAIASAEKGA